MKKLYTIILWCIPIILLMSPGLHAEGHNLLPYGTFDSGVPHFWNAEPGNSGATMTWATDEAHAPPRSLKIEKPGTATEGARWISDGQVRYWNPKVPEGVDIKVGAYVKTQGVNTDPQTEDAKWQLKFWFYDADGLLIGGEPFVVDIDQSQASRDWYEQVNDEGTLILPEEAAEWFVSADAGPNATGTVWFDTFIFHARDGWAGGPWNQFVNADQGWFYWIHESPQYIPAITAGVTMEEARNGDYSLKVEAPEGRSPGEMVWISETIPIPKGSEGKQYMLSAWVKTEGVIPDSVFNDAYSIGFTVTWHPDMFEDVKGDGWVMESSSDFPQFYLRKAEEDWQQLVAVYTIPSDAIGAVSIRLRIWHQFIGTVYWDDIEFSLLSDTDLMADYGTFDSGVPHFWQPVTANSGATLTWATDEAHAPPRSLKIEKPGTASEGARWLSDGQVRYWNPKVPEGVDIKVGAYVKTEGVNINPATEDAKWQLKYWFYDAEGDLIGGEPFTVDIDQSQASRDWYEQVNEEGTLILPEEAAEWFVSADAGPNATGTVWFDTFIFHARDGWAGGPWNQFVNADHGWFYWIHESPQYIPAITAGVTMEEARSGDYSLKVDAPVGRSPGELVWISETVPIPKGSEGDKYVLSAWVKTENVIPDSVFNDAYSIGFTATWHPDMFEDVKGDGWVMESSSDFPQFYLRKAEEDWKQLIAVYTIPSDAIGAVSFRLRVWHQFTGTVYWDDVTFRKVEPAEEPGPPGPELPEPNWNFAGIFPDEESANHSAHGLAVDDEGKVWIAPYYSRLFVPTEGDTIRRNPLYVFNADGTPADFSPIYQYDDFDGETLRFGPITGLNRDHEGNILVAIHGMRPLADGSTWDQGTAHIIRIDPMTGDWTDAVDVTSMRTETAAQAPTRPSVTEDGYIFVSYVFPGSPIIILDPDFELVQAVTEDGKTGFSRTLEVSADGTYLFQPGFSENRITVYRSEFGVLGEYEVHDTTLAVDMTPGAVNRDPLNDNVLWVTATGGGNDPLPETSRYFGHDNKVFAIDLTTREIVDYAEWPADPFRIPRSMAFSPDGEVLYVGTFTQGVPSVHKFTKEPVSVRPSTIADKFDLSQNYPNPFNPSTTIQFSLPIQSNVRLEIYNTLGQRVRTLVADEVHQAGTFNVVWDGRNDQNRVLPSGMYIYRITVGDFVQSKRMMFLK